MKSDSFSWNKSQLRYEDDKIDLQIQVEVCF